MAQKYDILYVNFYTDGSAARKVNTAVPASQPRKHPAAKKQAKTIQVASDNVGANQPIHLEENEPTLWDQFLSFLTNLLA